MTQNKNIHVLTTPNPSRLLYNYTLKSFCIQKEKDGMYFNDGKVSGADFWSIEKANNNGFRYVNIYITNDEEIKGNDYYLDVTLNIVMKGVFFEASDKKGKKIILTNDPKLIKEGVQSIPEDFLQWFVKNSSCEFVEVKKAGFIDGNTGEKYNLYPIIVIPNEIDILDLGQITSKEEPDWSDLENSGLDKPLKLIREINIEETVGKKVVEYCKKYEKSDKYNIVMLAIEFGYQLALENDCNPKHKFKKD